VSTAPAARLAPIPVEEWDDEARAALRGWLGKGAEPFLSGAPDAPPMPRVLATLMHHPRLAGPWLGFNDVLLRSPTLEPRHRELMILRVAWRTRSSYEWLQHVRLAHQLGITTDEVAAIAGLAEREPWTPLEADLLAATDQLLAQHRIDAATWARLAEHLDERQLVEVVFVVGAYSCLAMAFNSFGLELDEDLDPSSAPAMPSVPTTPDVPATPGVAGGPT
jgi:alkylhydroperoxidase family enzyme